MSDLSEMLFFKTAEVALLYENGIAEAAVDAIARNLDSPPVLAERTTVPDV